MTATSMSPAGHVLGAPRLVALVAMVVWGSPQAAAAHSADVVIRAIEMAAVISPILSCDGRWPMGDGLGWSQPDRLAPVWPMAGDGPGEDGYDAALAKRHGFRPWRYGLS